MPLASCRFHVDAYLGHNRPRPRGADHVRPGQRRLHGPGRGGPRGSATSCRVMVQSMAVQRRVHPITVTRGAGTLV
jgi:hypothetical protein